MEYLWLKNIIKTHTYFFVFTVIFAILCFAPLLTEAQGSTVIMDPDGGGATVTTDPPDEGTISTPGPVTTVSANGVKEPEGITAFIYYFTVGIGGWFLWLGGLMLNYSIVMLVIGMGTLMQGGIGVAVDNLWMVIRDIFNIVFIFGLIYIGFKTIWSAGDSSTKKAVGMLIAAALLINFSLYFTKAVVDFSNIAAYQIYQLIDVDNVQAAGGKYEGISGAFMQYTNLTSFADTNNATRSHLQDAAADSNTIADMRIIGYGFMVMIFLLITAFVFIAGAVLLIIRFVTLIILMIFSPILLLGFVIPKFLPESQKRLKQLINQALIAPAFLFMLYLSLTVLQQLHTSDTFAEAMHPANTSGAFQLIIYILVTTGFVIGSLLVAKQLGAVGADRAINMGKSAANWTRTKAQNAAGGAVFGGTAALGRSTIGRWSQKKADDEALKERAAQGGVRGYAARQQLALSRKVGDASFDARNVKGAGKALGIGEGAKGGYKTKRDAIATKEQKFADSLGEVGDDDPTVQKLDLEVKRTETAIKEAKLQKEAATTPEEKARVQARINNLEEDLNENNQRLKREKVRRQIGSAAYEENRLEHEKTLITTTKEYEKMKKQYRDSNGLSLVESKEMRKELREKKKQLKQQEKLARKGGYSGVLESRGRFNRWFSGRSKDQNENAAKEIRKKYQKKINQTKEDGNFETLREEFAKNVKNDDK